MSKFFYRNWWLYYLLLFLLIGLLIYALLWRVNFTPYQSRITSLTNESVSLKEQIIGKEQYIEKLEERLKECEDNLNKPVPQQPNVVQCNAKVESGGQGFTETTHNLGTTPGTVTIDYNMHSVPDRIDVLYNGKVVASTNQLVSGNGRLSFNYPAQLNMPTSCVVRLSAPESGTVWDYVVNCVNQNAAQ